MMVTPPAAAVPGMEMEVEVALDEVPLVMMIVPFVGAAGLELDADDMAVV